MSGKDKDRAPDHSRSTRCVQVSLGVVVEHISGKVGDPRSTMLADSRCLWVCREHCVCRAQLGCWRVGGGISSRQGARLRAGVVCREAHEFARTRARRPICTKCVCVCPYRRAREEHLERAGDSLMRFKGRLITWVNTIRMRIVSALQTSSVRWYNLHENYLQAVPPSRAGAHARRHVARSRLLAQLLDGSGPSRPRVLP